MITFLKIFRFPNLVDEICWLILNSPNLIFLQFLQDQSNQNNVIASIEMQRYYNGYNALWQ